MADIKHCSECGAENTAEAFFCENCGTKFDLGSEASNEDLSNGPSETVNADHIDAEEEVSEQVQYVVQPTPMKKPHRMPIIILIIIAFAGAGVFAYFHFPQMTEVNLTKNLDAEILKVDGYNGHGSISEIDMEKVLEKWDIDNQEENVQMFLKSVEITSDRVGSGGLSNGDAITIIAKYKRADAKKYKIDVVDEEKTVKVEGLQEKPPLKKYILGKWINTSDKKDLLVIKKVKYDGKAHRAIWAYYGQGGSVYIGPMVSFDLTITGISSIEVNMYGDYYKWKVTSTGLLKGKWGDGHTATYRKLGSNVHFTFRGQ